MTLYELCGADRDCRFSPYVWRTRLALHHKGLAYETVPVRFVEKEAFAESGSKTVPVIRDDGRWVADSWEIACYLEDTYPQGASLFGGATGRAHARFINAWADRTLVLGLFPLLAARIWTLLDPESRAYFRESREARLGMTLEEAGRDRETKLKAMRRALSPLEATLKVQDFLGGRGPSYADYAVAGPLIWAAITGDFDPLVPDSAIARWRDRIFALYDGLVAQAIAASADTS
ncbi:MAG: glutathione S-transferase family protein [Alphaproteobacteria bacterium]|nr:MAG: glutathione S-transferase family protein [Alphaproteobacteria bacterium]